MIRITYPTGGTLTQNAARRYVPSHATDIRETFRRFVPSVPLLPAPKVKQ